MKELPNRFVRWTGGPWAGRPDQLVQILCPGSGEEFADVPGPVMEAGLMDWRHRRSAIYPDQPHHGNILAYRPVGRLQITITILDNGDNPVVRSVASPMENTLLAPMLEQAAKALRAEINAFGECAFHREAK